jgi:hypothetical protein
VLLFCGCRRRRHHCCGGGGGGGGDDDDSKITSVGYTCLYQNKRLV